MLEAVSMMGEAGSSYGPRNITREKSVKTSSHGIQFGFNRTTPQFVVMAARILSESSVIKLDKAEKTAGLQRSKTLDISSGIGSPGKVGNNGIQEVVGSVDGNYSFNFSILVSFIASQRKA